ncbi:MAG: sigma-70 family RNA polymerase sigma factor [Solirubrobacterales bacterium]|nr:sigma-70 family RNA polymerase sigma factor [Solirubrobacterales bacterium]
MPLSDDQRAMLRLLAQREQGYEDIAALMGLSLDQVRAKVKEALAQLEDEGVAPPLLPAEPPVALVPEPPAANEPAPIPTPAAPAPEKSPPPAPPAAPRASGAPKLTLPSGKGARAAIGAGIAVVIALVVVLIVSGGGGGSDSSTSASTEPSAAESEASNETSPTAAGSKEITKAVLSPVGDASGKGVAIFGRVKNKLALQIEAEGLEPSTGTTAYTVWLAQSPQRMLPLASTEVGTSGKIGAQFEVPTEVLAYLANETFRQLVITKTDDAALKAALAKATKEERAPAYTGTAVLEGEVTGPIVGAAKEAEEKEGEEEGK